jgi:hypothetical protein
MAGQAQREATSNKQTEYQYLALAQKPSVCFANIIHVILCHVCMYDVQYVVCMMLCMYMSLWLWYWYAICECTPSS